MTYVRHSLRHIRASMERAVAAALTDWTSPTPPYGAGPVTVLTRAPKTSDLKPVEANTVFISHGSENDIETVQLGSGLMRSEHVLFVDVLGSSDTIALSIAQDVLDALRGMAPGTSRYAELRLRGDGTLLPGYSGEWVDVLRDEPNPELASWQSVKATLVVHFPGEDS